MKKKQSGATKATNSVSETRDSHSSPLTEPFQLADRQTANTNFPCRQTAKTTQLADRQQLADRRQTLTILADRQQTQPDLLTDSKFDTTTQRMKISLATHASATFSN